MSVRFKQEIWQRGEIHCNYHATDMEYTFSHTKKGILMTVSENYVEELKYEGETKSEVLERIFAMVVARRFFDYDGVCERAMLGLIFNL